jgi:phenylalanyl-tRNA synthetase beta chain
MNISHDWLQRFVPHGLGAEQVRDLITAHVATVEGFERLRADLEPFVVARVVESERIPETKLSFNKVDDGSGTLLEVVCGAPNVEVGTRYPFARTGTVMPGGMTIEKRKIRGFTSNGMLCSARELGLGEDHDGILALETDAAPGTRLLDVMPVGDVRLVVDVLPNRSDLLSHLGLAREIHALTGAKLHPPAELADLPHVPAPASSGEASASARGLSVRIEDAEGCSRYTAAVITNVTVCPSPDWLRACVESVGGRSINNVVDATNYLLHGFGQPMHAFDRTKLAGNGIVVRRARAGEKLVTLDGVERALDPVMLVIADEERATALAGVMGGRASEVTDATTEIVLEVATFESRRVRATRRAAGLSTDASYRFERCIDDAAVPNMLALGAALLAHVSGGHVETVLHVGTAPAPRAPVTVRPARVERVLGDAVGADEITKLLKSIGFSVQVAGDALAVTAPSWRHDVTREVDLIEEVARLRGFDRLPDQLRGAQPGTVPDHPLHLAGRRVRDALVAAGLSEVRPLPFTAGKVELADTRAGAAERLLTGNDLTASTQLVRVRNPLAEDEPFLRASVLDTLARRAEYNLTRMQGNVRIFEVGSAFAARSDTSLLPREEVRAALLVMGLRHPPHFTDAQPAPLDEWDVKHLACTLALAAFPGTNVDLAPGSARGGELWRVTADGEVIGSVSRVPLDAPVWAHQAFGVEITLGAMPNAPVAPRGANAYEQAGVPAHVAPRRYRALPTTPAAEFDLALIIPEGMLAAQVEAVLRESGGELLERMALFDEFRGKGLPEGTRSLAWRLTFRHPERTLRDKEIEGRRAQLLKTLENRLGVRPRTS